MTGRRDGHNIIKINRIHTDMPLVLTKTGGSATFEPHPATGSSMVRMVCVDVTTLERKMTPYGEKDVFRVVWESETARADGMRYCVWSRTYTPSLSSRSTFRSDLRRIRGRDITPAEEAQFDVDAVLLGATVQAIITHEEGGNGQTYAKISWMAPCAEPLAPSGSYIRRKDRAAQRTTRAATLPAREAPAAAAA